MSLERAILNNMVEEKLIAQEAKRFGINISNEMVDNELGRAIMEVHSSREMFLKSLAEEGLTEDNLRDEIRTTLTIEALMKAAHISDNRELQPQTYYDAWLAQVKKSAQLVMYDYPRAQARVYSARSSCCGAGGCGGCGRKNSGTEDVQMEKRATAAALEAYKKIHVFSSCQGELIAGRRTRAERPPDRKQCFC